MWVSPRRWPEPKRFLKVFPLTVGMIIMGIKNRMANSERNGIDDLGHFRHGYQVVFGPRPPISEFLCPTAALPWLRYGGGAFVADSSNMGITNRLVCNESELAPRTVKIPGHAVDNRLLDITATMVDNDLQRAATSTRIRWRSNDLWSRSPSRLKSASRSWLHRATRSEARPRIPSRRDAWTSPRRAWRRIPCHSRR